jgi:hypothetical protein
MAITESDVKAQIILEVGDVDPQTGDPPTSGAIGVIAGRIDYLWARYAAWDQVAAGLRELYARQAAIRLVLGVLSPRRFDSSDSRAGLSVRANQLWEHYSAMLTAVGQEIEQARASAAASGGASSGSAYLSGRIAHRVPVPVAWPPDPNAMKYGGTVRGAPEPDPVILDEVTDG